MAMVFGNTRDLGGSIKAMCYAPAGYGKTRLCATASSPLIISAEEGLLSVKEYELPFVGVSSMADFREAYRFVSESEHARGFETVCIDSLSDIAESALSELKKQHKDPRQAYGQLNEEMLAELRLWKHLSKNVYITCKQTHITDGETGRLIYGPMMPGQELPKQMPYWGDELMAIRIIQNEDGTKTSWLQTQADIQYYCKDRSGKLNAFETPNLTTIFAKIKGEM